MQIRILFGSLLALMANVAFAQAAATAGDAPAPLPAAPIASLFAGPLPATPATSLSSASIETQRVARWVVESRDNANLPFLIVDKANATVYAFGRDGQLRASAPALLGLTVGDKLKVPNDTQMAQMGDDERVTPAGRFLSRLAIDADGKELLVLDYDASISLHAVVKGKPYEHRAERLASVTSADNRISYGCINVPAAFYSDVVSPAFARTRGLVYVLPETGTSASVFGFEPFDAPSSALIAAAMNAPAATTLPAPTPGDAPAGRALPEATLPATAPMQAPDLR
jgi:hypothetical protein